jgi:UDP-N-acetylglucosamine:LPS N-acetylglucosamine transferase
LIDLETTVLDLLKSPQKLEQMATQAVSLADVDSASRLADLIRKRAKNKISVCFLNKSNS